MKHLVAFIKTKFQCDLKIKENSSPEFQKQVQMDLLALDQAAYTSLSGVPSKEQLQPEEVPVRKTKPPQNRYIKFKLVLEDTSFCIVSIVENKHIDTHT